MTYPTGPYGYGYAPPPPPPKPGVIPLAPLRFGEILTGAFSTYGRYWKPLIGVAISAYAGAALLVGALLLTGWALVGDTVRRLEATPSGMDADADDITALVVAFGVVWLAAMIVMLLSSALVYAAVPAVLQEAVLGRPIGFATAWRRAWSRLGSVLGTILLTALVTALPVVPFVLGFVFLFLGMIESASSSSSSDVGGGMALTGGLMFLVMLLAVPLAAWLWVKFSLAPTVAVIEQQGPVAAMRRSSALVRGSWWRIFGCTLAAAAMASMVGFFIQQIVSTVGSFPLMTYNPQDQVSASDLIGIFGGMMAVLLIGQLITQAVIAPFQPLVSGLLYVDQRIRQENLAPTLAQTAATPY
ncbi:oxidoreductase [Streptomyces sp. NPDC090025]|uniref:oxidoreductase n=1 Tax=Streptomyces sp. NPDC090025 TaxID=3365922 RepID=UPI003839C0CD